MNLTNLMPYDWVNVETPDGILAVQFLCFYNGYVITTNGEQYAADKISPICINTHIWKLNGFEKHKESVYSPDNYVLSINGDAVIRFIYNYKFVNILKNFDMESKCFFDFAQKGISHNIEIKYVYEIQHILRLLGYDEIAKNFKI